MSDTMQRDIQALYAQADQATSLATLLPALFDVLRRNSESLAGTNYAYRLTTADTGFTCAFALRNGAFAALNDGDAVDVTVTGTEANLLAVFQRKLNPLKAILLRKITVDGSMAALTKLASYL